MNERQARSLAFGLILAGVFVLIVGLALSELRTRGTSGVAGFTVADYAAQAETEAKPATPFSLPALDANGTISLASFRGKVVVLNFWATWCDPCRREAPGLQRVWQSYRDRGVQFLGVDERDNDPAGRAFVQEFGLTYPSGSDPPGRMAFSYGLFGMPTTFVIDRSGTIRYRFVGYLTDAPLRDALDHVLGREAT